MQDDGGPDRDDRSSDTREEKCAQVSDSFRCMGRRILADKFLNGFGRIKRQIIDWHRRV
jgi:hypothetical protein